MKTTVSVMMAMILSIASFGQNISNSSLLETYLKVKDALVQSDNTEAAKQAAALEKLIETAGEVKGKDELLKAAKKISKTPDIEKQRMAFAGLSTAMWALIKDAKDLPESIYYEYCPMKKSYWISNEEAIKNPYYGAAMLTCGNVSDKRLK